MDIEDHTLNKTGGDKSKNFIDLPFMNEPEFDYNKIETLREVDNINDHFKFGKLLGSGTFGEVKKARNIELDLNCAVKIISKEALMKQERMIQNFENELKVLETMCNQHITKTYELLHDKENFYIVMELVSV